MSQSANTLMLVRPSHFGYNQQTSSSNFFQQNRSEANISIKATREFDSFVLRLQAEKINTILFDDDPKLNTPDAVFPNNWITMHHDGTVILYPLAAPNRRSERKPEILEYLNGVSKLHIKKVIDLTHHEKENIFLEGTGSLVFDHLNKQVYAAISQRTHSELVNKLGEILGYQPILFHTKDSEGNPIYHTNVMMSIGSQFAVVCSDLISNNSSRLKVVESLDVTGRTIIELTPVQVHSFAGNILEVTNENGDPFILISETALLSLNKIQIRALEKYGILLPAAIPTIEYYGGGSVRCMVAEVFLLQSESRTKFIVRKPVNEQELKAGFDLRWKILRKPWNQPKGSETDDQESSAIHFLAFGENNDVIGTARLQIVDKHTAQIRYMAVDNNFEGKGVGKMLIREMEKEASRMRLRQIILQAREIALPFYKSAGYEVKEKSYLLFSEIQHYLMTKNLHL